MGFAMSIDSITGMCLEHWYNMMAREKAAHALINGESALINAHGEVGYQQSPLQQYETLIDMRREFRIPPVSPHDLVVHAKKTLMESPHNDARLSDAIIKTGQALYADAPALHRIFCEGVLDMLSPYDRTGRMVEYANAHMPLPCEGRVATLKA